MAGPLSEYTSGPPYFEVVDAVAVDDVETLSQDILDEHDDIVADLSICLKRLDSPETQSQDTQDPKKLLSRQLTHLEKSLAALHDAITTIPTSHEDISLIEQYDLKLANYRTEILGIAQHYCPSTTHEGLSTNLCLPKLVIPTFDGNILNWRQFWEQFSVSVHDRINLSNAEKLVYLQQSIKEG